MISKKRRLNLNIFPINLKSCPEFVTLCMPGYRMGWLFFQLGFFDVAEKILTIFPATNLSIFCNVYQTQVNRSLDPIPGDSVHKAGDTMNGVPPFHRTLNKPSCKQTV